MLLTEKLHCLSWVRSVASSLPSIPRQWVFLLTERMEQSTFWNETGWVIMRSLYQIFLATQQHRSEPDWLQIWEKCSSGSSKFMTSMSWSRAWSMSGIVSSKDDVVEWRKCLCAWICVKGRPTAFHLIPIMHMLFCISCMNIKQVLVS